MSTTAVRVPLLDLGEQHRKLAQGIGAAVARVFADSAFILGREVEAFEREFGSYLGAEAVGVGSGLDALRLALMALGVGPGDDVVLPANTYIATALAVSACGARPVLVDVREDDFGIDPERLAKAITPRTKAVIPVHLYGQPCDMAGVAEVAARAGVFVVEDASQAHGATWRGRRCGTIGDAGCFSFFPSKNLGAAGDGGMVVTRRPELARRIRMLRDYGQAEKDQHVVQGLNSRLDGLQAAFLRVKLPHLDEWNRRRAAHAATYGTALRDLADIRLPALAVWPEHVYHQYVIRVTDRERLLKHASERGVQMGIHYPVPIHLQAAYASLGYRPGDFPVTERLAREILSLPMYPELAPDQVGHVVSVVAEFAR